MKLIFVAIVSFVLGLNFRFIYRYIINFIFRLIYNEKKYFNELKINYDEDFYDYKFSKNDFDE